MSRILIIAGNARSLIANRGDLIAELKARGHEVLALVPAHDALPELTELGIHYELVGLDRRRMNVFQDLRSCAELLRYVRRLAPSAVFSYTVKPVVYGTLAARLAGVRRVTSMITGMGFLFTGASCRQRVGRLVAKSLYAAALPLNDVVFFQNPDDRDEVGYAGPIPLCRKAVMVPGSGVNLSRFALAPVPSGAPTFLLVARLLRDKGIAEFVSAASRLKRKHPVARFEVLGPCDPTLPGAISLSTLERWKAEGCVTFLDGVKDVRPELSRCSVFVLPSYREGTPRSVLEAMATGRAIITTDAPGCRQTVQPGVNGLLVPPRCPEALSNAMEEFIKNPHLAEVMGAASRRMAEDVFDVRGVNRIVTEHILGVA